MKKTFLLILMLLGLWPLVMAQGTIQPVDAGNLVLNLNFSPLPGSPGTNQPSGTANYYYLYNLGNSFSMTISLGTNQASDGWILQKESGGSYTPVMELTNETTELSFRPPVDPGQFPNGPLVLQYGYSLSAQLTAD